MTFSTGDTIIAAEPGQNSHIWTGGDGYSGGGGCGGGGSGGGDGKDGDGGAGTGEDVSAFTLRTWTLAPGRVDFLLPDVSVFSWFLFIFAFDQLLPLTSLTQGFGGDLYLVEWDDPISGPGSTCYGGGAGGRLVDGEGPRGSKHQGEGFGGGGCGAEAAGKGDGLQGVVLIEVTEV